MPIKVQTSNAFDVIQKSGVTTYFVTPKFALHDNGKTAEQIKKEDKDTFVKALGISVATTGIIAGLITLAIAKGVPKSSIKWLDKISDKLEQRLGNNKDAQARLTVFSLILIQTIKKSSQLLKGACNIASFKDIVAQRAIKKSPFKKLGQTLTEWFEKGGINSVTKSYKKANDRFTKMYSYIDDLNSRLKVNSTISSKTFKINGQNKTGAQWLDEVDTYISRIKETYKNSFTTPVRDERIKDIKRELKNIDERIIGNSAGALKSLIKDKKTYTTFMAEELASPAKIKLTEEVNKLRMQISNDINDNFDTALDTLKTIRTFTDPSDLTSRKIIMQLKEKLTTYKQLKGKNESTQREIIQDEIYKLLNTLKGEITSNTVYTESITNIHTTSIDSINKVLNENKKGALQEILTIYRQLLPDKEYQALKKKCYKSVKTLDNAINSEVNLLFDKIRDLSAGSAIWDSASILVTASTIGLGIAKANDKEERQSVLLKYGIPALGAIATSIYCTIRMISGGVALLTGSLSGLGMNLIGETIDEKIKKNFPNNS